MRSKVLTALLTILLGTFLTACSSDSVVDTVEQAEAVMIGYNTVSNKSSRAGHEINAKNITNEHFRVWGYNGSGGNTTSILEEDGRKMEDIDISYDKSRDEWVYTDGIGFHWPKWKNNAQSQWDGSYVHFFAFCPSVDNLNPRLGLTDNSTPNAWNCYIDYNAYDEKGDSLRNIDLMFATAQDQSKYKWNNTTNEVETLKGYKVQLTFKHLMSQLQFKIRMASSAMTAKVNSIKLYNIYSKGSININQYTENLTAVSEYNLKFNKEWNDGVTLNDTITRDLTTENPLFIFPQAITYYNAGAIIEKGNQKPQGLEIDCVLTLNGETVFDSSKDGKLYVPFAIRDQSVATTSWSVGKKITYKIHLGSGYTSKGKKILQSISVNPTVTAEVTEY